MASRTHAASTAAASSSAPTVLQRYDPRTMKPDATILFVGPRRTGKSTLVRDLLFYMQDKLFAAVAQTPTAETAEELAKILPSSCIHNDFDAAKLESAINAMKLLVQTERRVASRQGRQPQRRFLLVLLDDCMADAKNMKHKIIKDVFNNGRHYDLMFINVQQFIMDMPPGLRGNIDIVCCTYDAAPDNQERLWKYFFKTAFPKFERFKKAYATATSNFGALILDRTVRGATDDKKVFWYRAQHPAPIYRIGHKTFWIMHYRYASSRREELRENLAYISETVRKVTDVGEVEPDPANNEHAMVIM